MESIFALLCDWVHGVSGGELFPHPLPFSTRRIVFLPLFSSPDGMCGLQGFNCGSIEYYYYIIDGIVIEADKECRSTVHPFLFVLHVLCVCGVLQDPRPLRVECERPCLVFWSSCS